MPTGPINCFGDASPVTRSFKVVEDQAGHLDVPLDAHADRFEERRLVGLRLLTRAEADHGPIAFLVRRDGNRLLGAVAADPEFNRLVARLLRDRLRDLRREHHALAVDREDHVVDLDASRFSGLAGRERRDDRIRVRHHANCADFEPRAVARRQLGEIGANLEALFAAVAQHRDFDIALGPRRHRHLEMLPGADLRSAELGDEVAPHETGLLGRRTGLHGANHRRAVEKREHVGALQQHEREQDHGEHEVHHRSGDQDLEALPL